MLIYSEKHLLPTDVNVLTIAAKNGEGYFYVHRLLYDQAVILDDMYSDNPHELIKAVTGGYTSRGDVVTFLRDMPSPLNILGPFLLLVTEPIEDLIDMVGAMHVMSCTMNFRAMLKIPFAMRHQNPKFSLGIREEYQLSWDMFTQRTLPYNAEMLNQMAYGGGMQMQPSQQPTSPAATPTVVQEEEPEEVVEMTEDEKNQAAIDNAETIEDAMNALMNLSEDYWNDVFTVKPEDLEETEEEVPEPAPQVETPVVASTPEPEPVPVEEHPKDLVGALLSLAE